MARRRESIRIQAEMGNGKTVRTDTFPTTAFSLESANPIAAQLLAGPDRFSEPVPALPAGPSELLRKGLSR
jgi:hypothetical protein